VITEGSRSQRPGAAVVLAAASVGLLIAQHVAARAARDALFLSSFPVAALPKMMLAAAVIGVPAVLVTARATARFGPTRVVPALLVVSSLLYAAEWRLFGVAPATAIIVYYLHASIIGGLSVSGFWSVANERFDPHALRHNASVFSIGCALGGLLGGAAGRSIGSHFGVPAVLPVVAVSSIVAAFAVHQLGARSVHHAGALAPVANREPLLRSSYLRSMALVVVLTGLSGALLDFSFKAVVSSQSRSGGALVGVFATFYTATSIASVLLQLSLSRWLLARAGIGVTLAILPAAMVVLGSLGVAFPRAWLLTLVRGSGVALETSLFRAAYEPLYAPLPVPEKRSAKAVIDVACDRLGDALGSSWILVLTAIVPALAARAGLLTAVLASAASAWLAFGLERGYIRALAQSLRTDKGRLEATAVRDATAKLSLSNTVVELDRDALLAEIERLRSDAGATPSARATALAERAAALTSGDRSRVLEALAKGPLELELASLAVPLLADDDTAQAAVSALTPLASRIPGQLSDALLDPELPLALRRRLPRVLRLSLTPRAVRGLGEGLSAPDFVVRYRSALALRDLTQQTPALGPPRKLVIDAALRELEVERSAWSAQSAVLDGAGADHGTPTHAPLPDRALDHVFTLLGLAFDAEALDLARRAVSTADEKLRGTALEYLEHVVPEPLRSGIRPYLGPVAPARSGGTRSAAVLVAELKRTLD
jgi:AAA family ATP:ADP antiporter